MDKQNTLHNWIIRPTRTEDFIRLLRDGINTVVFDALKNTAQTTTINNEKYEYFINHYVGLTQHPDGVSWEDIVFYIAPKWKNKYWIFQVTLQTLWIQKRGDSFNFYGWDIVRIQKIDKNNWGEKLWDTSNPYAGSHKYIESFEYFQYLFGENEDLHNIIQDLIVDLLKRKKTDLYNSL